LTRTRKRASKNCTFPGCGRKLRARGLCSAHWLQQHEGRPLRPLRVPRVGCKIEGCAAKHHAHGYCNRHLQLAKNQPGAAAPKCTFKGCDRPIVNITRGLCRGHCLQSYKNKPLSPLRRIARRLDHAGKQKTPDERFDELVKKTPTGCWEWQGIRKPDGYGVFVDGRVTRKHGDAAHRYSWARSQGLAVGSLPKKLAIDHLCRNRACVNPSHLDLVRPGQNTENMLAWHTLEAAVSLFKAKREELQERVAALKQAIASLERPARARRRI
jgi:hypothetical protein